MYIDDLPIWGMVGEVDDSTEPPSYKIFTHKKLDIGFYGYPAFEMIASVVMYGCVCSQQIVDVNLTSDGRVKLAPGVKLDFSYEVAVPIRLAKEDKMGIRCPGQFQAVQHSLPRPLRQVSGPQLLPAQSEWELLPLSAQDNE